MESEILLTEVCAIEKWNIENILNLPFEHRIVPYNNKSISSQNSVCDTQNAEEL